MKVKTSITLSRDVIAAIDKLAGKARNRSAVIERAVRELVASQAKRLRDARDLEILNRDYKRMARHMKHVLRDQIDL